jgi:hypothetical protein
MDNRYHGYGCPPLMSDGRFTTNYIQNRIFLQEIRNVNKIGSSQEFKRFLQNNACSIMKNEQMYHIKNNTCDIDGKCEPLSGVSSSCSYYPNAYYGTKKGCLGYK